MPMPKKPKQPKVKQVKIKGKIHFYVYDTDGRIITHGLKKDSGFKTNKDVNKKIKQFMAQNDRLDFFTLRKRAVQRGKRTFVFVDSVDKAKRRRIYKRTGWQYYIRIRAFNKVRQGFSEKYTQPITNTRLQMARQQALSFAMGQIDERFYNEDEIISTLEKSNRIEIIDEGIAHFDRR